MAFDDQVKEISLKTFRKDLTVIIGNVQQGKNRVKVTSYGRTAGYFISEADMHYLEQLEELLDSRTVAEMKATGEDKDVVSWDQAVEQLGL